MSGHSKWSKIKHQKESTDALKGKIFTKLTKAIIVAVKESGGNTEWQSNFKLRLAIDKAKESNMPRENIERAIQRGKGNQDSDNLFRFSYEAFGPGGMAIIIETATDNKLRTVSEIKNILERSGGSLATTGAVSYLFDYLGLIVLQKMNLPSEVIIGTIMESDALDFEDLGSLIRVYTKPEDLHRIKDLLSVRLPVETAELTYKAKTPILLNNLQLVKIARILINNLEENDDVFKVYTNAVIQA